MVTIELGPVYDSQHKKRLKVWQERPIWLESQKDDVAIIGIELSNGDNKEWIALPYESLMIALSSLEDIDTPFLNFNEKEPEEELEKEPKE